MAVSLKAGQCTARFFFSISFIFSYLIFAKIDKTMRFPAHFDSDVSQLLHQNYKKIQTQQDKYTWKDKLVDSYTFRLVDKNKPFSIEDFISILSKKKSSSRQFLCWIYTYIKKRHW